MSASAEPQLNALAVAFAAIMTGLATASEYLPLVTGTLTSVGGLALLLYMLKHRRLQIESDALQIKIDKVTLRKVTAEADLAERELKKVRKSV